MEKQIVVTIGRAFGSKGREIGEKLAKELGISFYDKNIILMAAEKSGMKMSLLEQADEQLVNRFVDPYALSGTIQGSTNDRLYRAQSEVIREVAAKESCVIVGRLADQILKYHPNCIKVFVYAPFDVRVNTIKTKHNLSEGEAKRLVKQMDKIRGNYYSYFSDGTWDQKEGKNLLIDSDFFGVDGSVELLKRAIELRMQEK